MDNSDVFEVRLQSSPTKHRHSTIKKKFPVLPINSFRYHFAFDTIAVLDTFPWAKNVAWAKDIKQWSFSLFRFIVDDLMEKPYQTILFNYNLVFHKNLWHLQYAVQAPPGSNKPPSFHLGSPILQKRAYCLEYLLQVGPDSVAQSVEFKVNGRTDCIADLTPTRLKVTNQILEVGSYNLKYITPGSFYLDNLAFGNGWIGGVPARPEITPAIEQKSRAFPQKIMLFSPLFSNSLVRSRHLATQYQIQIRGMDWRLPLFDSDRDSTYRDSLQIEMPLNPSGKYSWRVRHFDENGNRSDWSRPVELTRTKDSSAGELAAHPIVYNIYFSQINRSLPLEQIRHNTWYDLVIKASEPRGLNYISYGVIWCNNENYTFGNIQNRGGRFFPQSNYAVNFSVGPNKVFEKRHTGKYKFSRLIDTLGLYLDASQNRYRINPKDSTFRLRVRILDAAKPGKWSLRGYVRNNEEKISPFYYANFEVLPAGADDQEKLRTFPFYAYALAFLVLVGILIAVLMRREKARHVMPSRDQEIFSKFDAFVKANLEKDLSIQDIEQHMNMGYSNLYRIVKAVSGKSIKNHMIGLKIERARMLLKTTNLNVTEVMQAVGFNNSAHFSTVFKKYSGKSPRQFREESR